MKVIKDINKILKAWVAEGNGAENPKQVLEREVWQ